MREISVRYGDKQFDALTEDISRGGVRFLLEAGARVTVGDWLHCTFAVPGLPEPRRVTGEVRWIDDGLCLRVGVKFSDGLRPAEIWALARCG